MACGLARGRGAAAVRGGDGGEARTETGEGRGEASGLPVHQRWSRRHADTQRRLCERFAEPVIATVSCQDIKTEHTQKIVNAAPTAGEGDRVHRMISAMVTAGLDGGYLTNPRLARVHWRAGDRALPASQVSVAGESVLWVDPAEIPADSDVAKLGLALAAGARGNLYELLANAAAYSGLRWGELAALTIPQIDPAARAISVDRKIVEVAGQLYLEAPKNRKRRRTIYPRRTPAGYPLADRLASRIQEARAEQEAGANPLGLVFPSVKGRYWQSSNFNRRVLAPAYRAVGWRDAEGNGAWTWHSLRHVSCTTELGVVDGPQPGVQERHPGRREGPQENRGRNVRKRLPHLPALADDAGRCLAETTVLLAAAAECEPHEVFDHASIRRRRKALRSAGQSAH